MGRLFIPAKQNIKGPWLLSQENLESLESTIEIIYSKLIEAVGEDNKTTQKGRPKLSKKIVLTSKDKIQIYDSSILGILKDQKTNNFTPIELYIEIGKRYSNYSIVMVISTKYDGELEYSIECSNERIKDEIKYELDKWLEHIKPNKIKQLWSNNYLNPIILFIGAVWLLLLISNLYVSPKSSYKKEVISYADSLIEVGISDKNINEAVDILLKLETNYEPESNKYKPEFQTDNFKILVISLIVFLILIFPPKTTIGIGKRKTRLKFYKLWQKVVLVSIPSLILLPILIETMKNIFK